MSSAICFNLDQSEILSFVNSLTLNLRIPTFNFPETVAFWKYCVKGDNVGYQHFLLFPRFLPFPYQISLFLGHIYCVACKCSQFEPVQILLFG